MAAAIPGRAEVLFFFCFFSNFRERDVSRKKKKRRGQGKENKNERYNSQHRERLCPVVLDTTAQSIEPESDVVPLLVGV